MPFFVFRIAEVIFSKAMKVTKFIHFVLQIVGELKMGNRNVKSKSIDIKITSTVYFLLF